ncbi:MAG TPA: DUF4235 domain-containing protein [Dermatophilaceae bacterium]|jgi:hypothetical protein|nr:DUF4235 domain-containing protein [Actinomycetales bacterium]HMT31092.1 DUF4235 domain-containing protein [Dermatophilaceae bacterium]HMT88083.1 DUF4235 domain-containing protein [Dermatophilaceae bacterium]
MGSMVWRVLGTGSAVIAAAVAQKLVSKGWEISTGKPAPDDPTHPEDTTWKEAVLFAALTGLAVSAARVAAQRKAAQYYAQSAGHLPAALQKATD